MRSHGFNMKMRQQRKKLTGKRGKFALAILDILPHNKMGKRQLTGTSLGRQLF